MLICLFFRKNWVKKERKQSELAKQFTNYIVVTWQVTEQELFNLVWQSQLRVDLKIL